MGLWLDIFLPTGQKWESFWSNLLALRCSFGRVIQWCSTKFTLQLYWIALIGMHVRYFLFDDLTPLSYFLSYLKHPYLSEYIVFCEECIGQKRNTDVFLPLDIISCFWEFGGDSVLRGVWRRHLGKNKRIDLRMWPLSCFLALSPEKVRRARVGPMVILGWWWLDLPNGTFQTQLDTE